MFVCLKKRYFYGIVPLHTHRHARTPRQTALLLTEVYIIEDSTYYYYFRPIVGYNSSDTCPSINIGIYGASSTLSCTGKSGLL